MAVTLGDRDPDVASVAAPVLGPDGESLGALVLAGILGRFEPRVPDFKPIVKQAAATISQQLSGMPAPAPVVLSSASREGS